MPAVATTIGGKLNVIRSILPPRRAVDVVKFKTTLPLEVDSEVMISAVAAADTQPTHGVFTRAAIVSLLVLISTPPGPDASEAASGCVVRPLHVTVTAPAGK